MKRILLLRHAKSSWDDPSLPDRERPLAPRGRRATERIARHLAQTDLRADLVLCSSARRTRETLEGLGDALGQAETSFEDALYAASDEELLERLRALPEEVERHPGALLKLTPAHLASLGEVLGARGGRPAAGPRSPRGLEWRESTTRRARARCGSSISKWASRSRSWS